MGTGSARVADTCLTFAALLSADDFFSGLEIKHTSSGVEFFKESRRVTEFPDRLSIEVLTWAWKCGGTKPEDANIARSVLQKIRFQAGWKTGMRIRPVKKLTTNLKQPSPEEWKDRTAMRGLEPLGIQDQDLSVSGVWIFELLATDEQIPLTDSLTVVACDEGGKQLVRFTARL